MWLLTFNSANQPLPSRLLRQLASANALVLRLYLLALAALLSILSLVYWMQQTLALRHLRSAMLLRHGRPSASSAVPLALASRKRAETLRALRLASRRGR